MIAEYAVRVVEYKTGKGNQIVITFKNEALQNIEMMQTPYLKLWGKGSRLYFLTASPQNGTKFGESGKMMIAKEDLVGELRRFIGEYSELKYDDATHYYYIDSTEKRPAEVDNGRCYGRSCEMPNGTRGTKGKGMDSITNDIADAENQTKNDVVKASAVKQETTVPVKAQDDSTKDVLITTLVGYVLNGKHEAAEAIAMVMKNLKLA